MDNNHFLSFSNPYIDIKISNITSNNKIKIYVARVHAVQKERAAYSSNIATSTKIQVLTYLIRSSIRIYTYTTMCMCALS